MSDARQQLNEMKKFMQIAEGKSKFLWKPIVIRGGAYDGDTGVVVDVERVRNDFGEAVQRVTVKLDKNKKDVEIHVGPGTSQRIAHYKAPVTEDDDKNNCGVCGEDFDWVGNPEDTMCPSCEKEYHGIDESDKGKPYICVHVKKGKHECYADSSYGAAKKAAEHWGLKSTAGIDAHLAIDESTCEKCGRKGCKCGPDCTCEPVNEAAAGMIEIAGEEYPWRRVPIEAYDDFKAQYPGSNIRFRGPRHGKDNTSKHDATHFYVVRTGRKADQYTSRFPDGIVVPPKRKEDLPHTPGMNKLGSGARAAADSRAQAFIFDDVNEDLDTDGMGYYNVTVQVDDNFPDEVETALAYDDAMYAAQDLVAQYKKGRWEAKKFKKGDAVEWQIRWDYSGDEYFTVIRVEPTDDADVEAWHGESIKLGSIVESVLEEFPGQPKDYYEPEDEVESEESSSDDDYDGYIEDEELGLRFD